MEFIEITDENATLEQDDPEISSEHIDEQYQKLISK